MRQHNVAISPMARQALEAASVQGNVLTLVGHLDRKDYVEVDRVITLLGGRWDKRARGHVFGGDPREAISRALGDGQVLDRKKTLQAFFTPPAIAHQMIALADLRAGDHVLEPSAGVGNLLRPILGKVASIQAVDIDETHAAALEALPDVNVRCRDFLEMGVADFDPRPTLILMNPPFAAGADVRHVMAAHEVLAPGGRLVAIMSPHAWIASDRLSARFIDWLQTSGRWHVDDLPSGAFAESGTEVRTRILFVGKAA
jgi:predicted RNA methylase